MRDTIAILSFAAFLAVLGGASTGLSRRSPIAADSNSTKSFQWPAGKRAAVSLSFDDGRLSQVDTGLALLRKHDVKVTFFLIGSQIEERLEGWRQAVAGGHEIGNHSMTHPCTGSYEFSRRNALEDYTRQAIDKQLDDANAEITRLLGAKPRTFAYPCGQKFFGRGGKTKSYVPAVAKRFLVGRGYLDEAANDPAFTDLAQALGTPFDDMGFEQMVKLTEQATEQGRWIIFVGHEIGKRGFQVTDANALEAFCDYAKDPAHGIWLGTVGEIGTYVQEHRKPIT